MYFETAKASLSSTDGTFSCSGLRRLAWLWTYPEVSHPAHALPSVRISAVPQRPSMYVTTLAPGPSLAPSTAPASRFLQIFAAACGGFAGGVQFARSGGTTLAVLPGRGGTVDLPADGRGLLTPVPTSPPLPPAGGSSWPILGTTRAAPTTAVTPAAASSGTAGRRGGSVAPSTERMASFRSGSRSRSGGGLRFVMVSPRVQEGSGGRTAGPGPAPVATARCRPARRAPPRRPRSRDRTTPPARAPPARDGAVRVRRLAGRASGVRRRPGARRRRPDRVRRVVRRSAAARHGAGGWIAGCCGRRWSPRRTTTAARSPGAGRRRGGGARPPERPPTPGPPPRPRNRSAGVELGGRDLADQEAAGIGEVGEPVGPVQLVRVGRRQHDPAQPPQVSVSEQRLDHHPPEPGATRGLDHEHVRDPRERRPVRHRAGEPGLRAVRPVQPDHHAVRDRALHHLARHPRRPVRRPQETVQHVQVQPRRVVVHDVPVA